MNSLELLDVVKLLVTVFAAGRLTRLVVADHFPPVLKIVNWMTDKLPGNWAVGLGCHWCLSPWFTLVVGGLGLLTDFHLVWWLLSGWLALSYLVAMLVERDEAPE